MFHVKSSAMALTAALSIFTLSGCGGDIDIDKAEREAANKLLVTNAMTALFIRQDAEAVRQYWGDTYLQHNPNFPDGPDTVLNMPGNLPDDFKYEMGAVLADDDLVIVRGRYTGFGPQPLIGADMYRVEDGKIIEHWDILQPEVAVEDTASGRPMFEPGM